MAHQLDIDNKKPHRHVDRTSSGRVAEAYETFPEARRQALHRRLRRDVRGEVRFDMGGRALYATDASNYRQVPLGVVVPRDAEDVETVVSACREAGAAITPRGGGTGLAGGACNTAVIIDFSRYMDKVVWLDADKRRAAVEPGCILDTLRDAAQTHGLTFGPDPATHRQNTLGGMIGNNSCGVHSVMAGRTSDNVARLDVLTADGIRMWVGPTSDEEFEQIVAEGGRKAEIYRALDAFRKRHADMLRNGFPDIPRRVSGYENLDQLLPEHGFNVARALTGTEAGCVTVLGAELELMPSPPERVLAILGFDDVYAAADAVPEVLEYGPIGLEGIDDLLISFIRDKRLETQPRALMPEGDGWLIVEFGADTSGAAAAQAQRLIRYARESGWSANLIREPDQQQRIWDLREAALAATAHVEGQPETWPGWEDSAVPREALGDYLRDLKRLFQQHGYEAAVYGHFGDGLVHCRIPFDLRTEDGIANWTAFLEEAADLVASYGGSLSGEHGDGQARAALLGRMYPAELLDAFAEFKAIWDPEDRMNPGKVVAPYPVESNLRIGPRYQPDEPEHHFAYPEDGGSFARATRRCVGVGACRQPENADQVMCPSYQATRDEMHVTRGRARLLFEMLHGGAITDGFGSKQVEEALDLCLGCKGCKSDCPVHVDMATYKAEFRAKHYARRLRPVSAHTMGRIHQWARIGGLVPWLANFATQTPGLSAIAKRIGGIAPERKIPRFSPETFQHWFKKRPQPSAGGKRVVLWPDTFNNHFRIDTAKAAAELLERLGYEVVLPEGHVCCGRPLYDWGRLDEAKALWRRNFRVLDREIRDGTPIVGLEPACVSAFRDELPGLFAGNERAEKLSRQTRMISEFLVEEGVDVSGGEPADQPEALVQMHCHEHAVLDKSVETRLLGEAGVAHEVMASGCCGMAGSFGFEAEKYEVSQAAAERVLLPRVREAPAEAPIIANGYSCREQIEQNTGRTTLHIADVLAERLCGPTTS